MKSRIAHDEEFLARCATRQTDRDGVSIIRILTITALGVVLTFTSLTVPQPAEAANRGTLVIGDSLTARGKDKIQRMHPTWVIDGKRGRHVSALPAILDAFVTENGPPRHLVIALGSNSSAKWSRAKYDATLAKLPAGTAVTFVTPYRDPRWWGEDAKKQRRHTRWMQRIARDRPLTNVAPWRWRAKRGTGLLFDGVHQTDPKGEVVWARTVSRAVASLKASR